MATPLDQSKEFWNDFGFDELQEQLDEYANEIAIRQDEAESGRKRLIEMSKDFKRTCSDEIRKNVSPLLKAFQAEIDSLTKRSKYSESCFLMVYKKLSDAPDPSPIINQAVASKQKLSNLTDLELEKKQLRETLEQYNLQFTQFKSQENELENMKKKFEECQINIAREVESRVSEMKESLNQDYLLKESILNENNNELSVKLAEKENMIENFQHSMENTESELFDFKKRYDEEMQTKNAEIELYLSDLEIANQKLNQTGKVIEQYQNSSSKEGIDKELNDLQIRCRLFEAELQNKDNEISRLLGESHNLQTTIAQKDAEFRVKLYQYEQEITDFKDKFANANEQLSLFSDYDEIKNELSILKVVEFGESFESNKEKTLEYLLLNKNRALQADNSNLRLEVHNFRKNVSTLENDIDHKNSECEELSGLVKQLEDDLTQLQSHRVREEADGEPSQAIEIVEISKSEESVDMLAIVTSQRERFKAKNQILETDYQQLKTSYAILQQDNTTLRTDNMKLYERIKFLQTMSTTNLNLEDDLTSKYSSQYEAHIDPFSDFNRKERQRKYVNLNSAERVVLNLGKMILSDKIARHAVFIYSIVLHLLVFMVLYKFAVAEDCLQLSNCNDAFQAHMKEHHNQP